MEKDSSISNKESISDISIDLQLSKDLGGNKKPGIFKKQNKSNYSDLLKNNLESAHEELRIKLEALTQELGQTKKERENLLNEVNVHREEVKKKDKEIEILKTTYDTNTLKAQLDNFSSSVDKLNLDMINSKKNFQVDSNINNSGQSDNLEEIRKLKKEISENEGYVDVLNLKIDELTKTNKDIHDLNESLKEQLQKRTEKMNKEMTSLYQQMKDLELKKNDFENPNNLHLNETENNLKSENNKKMDEMKSKYEKELQNLKNDLSIKENQIKELEIDMIKTDKELSQKSEDFLRIQKEHDISKEKIQETKLKIENLNKIIKQQEFEQELNKKMMSQLENHVKSNDSELKEIKETITMCSNQTERLKKIEKSLKNELNNKNEEYNKKQEILKLAKKECDKLIDDILQIKKEKYNLSTKLEFIEMDFKNKNDIENKLRQQELKSLREKEKKYEKLLIEMKETLKKKQKIIDNKKKMNFMLVDLAKVKKGEVQCLETLLYTKSSNLKETLLKMRENEKELLTKLGEISTHNNLSDSEEENYEEYEGSDFEYDDIK